ncbi:MAG: glycosyltransferase [Candidatus Omnitrophica bacterium]|nr:glycosyltransferase [Candidatus Omnitrophota bacterium]
MNMEFRKLFMNFLVVGALIAVVVYVITRSVLFMTGEYSPVERVFAVMLIVGELFILLHAFGYAANIFRIMTSPKIREEMFPFSARAGGPSVAVLVTARHEPKEVLEKTFTTINAMDYPNKKVYFLDDSSEDSYKKEADEIASEYGLVLFRRKIRHGAKAGIINDCLKNLTEKYVVIFDADQNPMPNFLKVLVPMMERDDKLAFIQTPQFYSNIDKSAIARGAAFQQAVFYEYICEGKSSGGAMFCCGTNVIFRREALVSVGGLDESTVTEDFATSVKLHSAGWRSRYYDHVSAFGMGPEDLNSYFKQQFRWAVGTISVFRKLLWRFLTRPFSLKPLQWWEYFLSSTYYLIGIAFFFLMICPITYLLFRIPSFFTHPEIYFFTFLPYLILSVSVFYIMLGNRHYSPQDLFIGQLLGVNTFSIYIRAAASALLGVKVSFGVTGKVKEKRLPYWRLWPQMTMMFFCVVTVVWGANRYIYEREPAILVNSLWALYYFLALAAIFYFNEER